MGVLALAGCDGASAETADTATTETPLVKPQGMSLQGMSLQGMSLQGMSLQGMSLQGMSLQGMSLQGMSLQGMSLQGTSFQGTDLNGSPVAIPVGSVLSTTDGSGATVTLRIANIQQDWQDAAGEVNLYAVEALDTTGQWQNVCNADPWGERWAIPVAGSWDATGAHIDDPKSFTFGCTSGVIAKCVRWGYRPWKSKDGVSLAPYHQACTRMARADYCGDGQTHTMNGTLIDMYDPLGIQTPTPQDPTLPPSQQMKFEAAWTPDGAYCLSRQRWLGQDPTYYPTGTSVLRECPQKISPPSLADVKADDQCHIKLTSADRSAILLSNRSFVNLLSTVSTTTAAKAAK